MASGAQPAARAAYRVLRELGTRTQRTFAAKRDPHELVVLHRFVRSDDASGRSLDAVVVTPEQLALLLRDATCLAKNFHPNVARVKHVDLTEGEVSIATELLDGATLEDLLAAAEAAGEALPLDVLVRIAVDVLGGVQALHGLRDDRHTPLGVVHGELCPANVVVGRDGIARVINVLRPRPLRIAAGSEAIAYVAPETLDGSAADPRADIYAVGVLIWSILAKRPLHDEKDPSRVLARLRELEIPRPKAPDAAHGPLVVDVAMRALSFEKSLRFRTAGEMIAELRKVPHIATGSVVATLVNKLEGERIRARRAGLDGSPSGSRPRVATSAPIAPPKEVASTANDTERPPPIVPDTSPTDRPPPEANPRDTLVPSSEAHLRVAPVSVEPAPAPAPPKPAPAPPKLARPATKPIARPPTAKPSLPPRPPVAEVAMAPDSAIVLDSASLVAAEPISEAAPVAMSAPPAPPPSSNPLAFAPTVVAPEPPPPPPSDPVMPLPLHRANDEAPPQRRSRGLVVLFAAAVLLLGVIGVVLLLARSGERPTTAAAPPPKAAVTAVTVATTAPSATEPSATATATATSTATEAPSAPAASQAEPSPLPATAAPRAVAPAVAPTTPTPQPVVTETPKPSPRPTASARRYEPLGI